MKLVLSRDAARDFAEIDDFTTSRWGNDQSQRYLRELRKACARVADEPTLGRAVNVGSTTYRLHRVASHIVAYRVDREKERVEVVGIFHKAMDVSARLADRFR